MTPQAITAEVAHLLHFGISHRRLAFGEVMEWAEDAFRKNEDEMLMELVLCTTPHRFLDCLQAHFDIQLWLPKYERLILSHSAKLLDRTPHRWLEVEEQLLHYWTQEMAHHCSPEEKPFLYFTSLCSSHRQLGLMSFEECERQLREGLAPYLNAEDPNDLLMAVGLPPLRME